jgi:hypothetical protein
MIHLTGFRKHEHAGSSQNGGIIIKLVITIPFLTMQQPKHETVCVLGSMNQTTYSIVLRTFSLNLVPRIAQEFGGGS